MKLPDLSRYDEAGVLEYHGHPDAIAAAASHAKLRYLNVDLAHAEDKATLFHALSKGFKLPEHFGNNFDALADSLEDRDWLGKKGCAFASAMRRIIARRTRTTGGRSRKSFPKPAPSGASATCRSGFSSTDTPHRGARVAAWHSSNPSRYWCSYTRPICTYCCSSAPTFPSTGNRSPAAVTGRRPRRHRAARACSRKPASMRDAFGGPLDWNQSQPYEIFPQWRHRYPPGTTHNTEHVYSLDVREPVPVTLSPREHLRHVWLPWREAAARCFSWTNRDAILALPSRVGQPAADRARPDVSTDASRQALMAIALASRECAPSAEGEAMRRWIRWMCLALPLTSAALHVSAQALVDVVPTPQPIVTVTASATSNVANDRMHAFLRAEVDNADATQAANDVNARMARALTRAKAVAGVEASTAGYSSYQVTEQNRPPRWRVSQTLVLESGDFAALSALVSKLQGTDGLVLRGLEFHGKRRHAPRRGSIADATGDQELARARAERCLRVRRHRMAHRSHHDPDQ